MTATSLPPKAGYVRMEHPGITGVVYAKLSAYRDVWYFNGWRSDDDAVVVAAG